MDNDPPPKRALAHASAASPAPFPHLSSDSLEQLTQGMKNGATTTSGPQEQSTTRKRRRTSSLGRSEGLYPVEEEGGEQVSQHLGPGRRRGRVDYASPAAETSDPYGFYPSPTRSSDRLYRPSGSERKPSPAPRPLPARMVGSPGWTLADDVELAQLARSFKIILPSEGAAGQEEEGEVGVDWEQLKRRFGGGLRKTRDELEERWKTLEDEVNDAIACLNGEEEEEDAESSSEDGWSHALDAALLSAVDRLSFTPIAAYASLDILLANPSESNYSATAWETIGELFENKLKASSLVLPAELDTSPDVLHAQHQALLHPPPPPPPRPLRRHTPRNFPSWSRSETSLLLSTVLSLGGNPSFPDGGWDDRVEETARWIEVSVAVGGEREMRDVVTRWAEMRGEVEGQKEVELEEEEMAMGLGGEAVNVPSPVALSLAVTPVPIPATTSSDMLPALRRKRNWTSEEDRLLSQLSLAGVPHAQIAEQLDRSEKAVDRRLEDWARGKKAKRQEEELFSYAGDDEWENWEEEAVEGDDDYPSPGSSPAAELACDKLSSSASASKRRQPWTASDDETLHRLDEEGVSPADIAQQLDRTEVAIVIRLGIWKREQKRKESEGLLQEEVEAQDGLSAASPAIAPKPAASAIRRPWSADEDGLIVRLSAEGFSNQEIGVQLERTTQAVEYRLKTQAARSALSGDEREEDSEDEYVSEDGDAFDAEEAPRPSSRTPASKPVPISAVPFSEAEDVKLLALRAQGKTFVEIGVALNRAPRRLCKRYHELTDQVQEAAPSLSAVNTAAGGAAPSVKRRRKRTQEPKEGEADSDLASPQPSAGSRSKRSFTEREDEDIKRLRKEGKTWGQIAAQLGRHSSTLSSHWSAIKKADPSFDPAPKPAAWTAEQEAALRAGRAAGESFALIAARIGRTAAACAARWAGKKAEWQQAGLLLAPSSALPAANSPSSHQALHLPPCQPSVASTSTPLYSHPLPGPIAARPAPLSSSPSFRRLPPLPAASFTFPTSAQPPPAIATAPTHSAQTSVATSAQPQFRPPRHHPLLSRIRRVLEENEDGSDEED